MNKMFTSLGRLALLLGADAITLPTSPVHSVEKAGGKIKGKHKVKTEEGRHRREMGKLSYGLKRYSEKKGKLPAKGRRISNS